MALALLGVVLCGAVGFAQSQPAPGTMLVEDVIPQGNRHVATQKIISVIRTRPGSDYSDETVKDDVRKLYETKLFANVQARTERTADNKIKVYFIVYELPSTIQEIIYNGAKHLKADELEQVTGLRKGQPLNPLANQMAVNAILARYHDMGRKWASVQLVEGDKPDDTRVVFNITEGRVVRISGIEFTGNTFVSGPVLNTHVDTSRAFLGVFGGQLEMDKIDRDVVKLEEYYKGNGFHDVHVSRELLYEDNGERARIIFHVNEGQRYRVAKVQVEGNQIKSTDELLSHSKQSIGDYYNQKKVDADKQIMQAVYGYTGRDAQVREQTYFPAPGQVEVQYEITERPPARVGQIFIVGNEVTKDRVILRQIPLYPGQVLTYPDLRVAESNLARLNIFEMKPEQGIRPTVTVIDPDLPQEYKDLLVQVHETQTGSLMFGVGVNSDAGLVGSIALNERNFDITNWPTSFDDLLSGHAFRGAGQEFRAEAVPGTQLQRYTVSWREPMLFDSPYSLQTSIYYYDRQYNEYTETRGGGRITLGRQLNRYWSVSGSLRLEDVGVHNVPYYEPIQISEDVGDHFVAGLKGAVTFDNTDSYLRPTEGWHIETSYEQFLGDYTFPQLMLTASKYFTLYERADGSGRQVLAARSVVGLDGTHAPVFERFYAGGFQSMRGFEFRGVGPAVNGFFIGGDWMFLNSLEYQLPILANDHLYAVAFLDTGTVENSVEIRNYRVSTGFGLRITVPMLGPVPIALDFGFPIVKADQDKQQVFSFWVGFFH
jgi:outer membrane protein assembly complex protein YaeT